MASFSLVIPTTDRASLGDLLDSLAACDGPLPEHVVVVDDRRAPHPALSFDTDGWPGTRLRLLDSDGRGRAAARNVGWRAARSEWVCFLDDDVTVGPAWLAELADDLAAASSDVAATQGRWIPADLAYRRGVLERFRGFDERFGRTGREDEDLASRVTAAGGRLSVGGRQSSQPARRARWADGVGRRGWHVATVAAAGLAMAATSRRSRTAWAMAATSLAIPPTAVAHRVRGSLRDRDNPPWTAIAPSLQPPPMPVPIEAVLLHLAGTLTSPDGSTDSVKLLPGVERALARLRTAGVKLGVLTDQPGSKTRVEELLGPFDTWQATAQDAAAALDVSVGRCAVIGNSGSQIHAGLAAGAEVTILVPSAETSPEEIYDAPLVFATLAEATDELIINHTRRIAA